MPRRYVLSKFKSQAERLAEKVKKLTKTGEYIGSKWGKTNVLLHNRYLRKFIPKTRKFSESIMKGMLNEFEMIYLKPIKGTYGQGVMRVEKRINSDKTTFLYQMGIDKKRFHAFPELFQYIKKKKLKRKYIAQQGIYLLKYKKSLFDLRIMVQKNLKRVWETTGIIGRVAHPKKIVTNYHSGGTPMAIKTIFKPYLSVKEIGDYQLVLKGFGQDVAKAMCKRYPNLNMLGVDVGVDKKLYPWILEVNTNPDLYIFLKLKNKLIFRRMFRYAKRLKRT